MPKDIKAVILAGGLGTRMKSDYPKVLHSLRGRSLIEYVLNAVRSAGISDIICVLSHEAAMVEKTLKGVKIVRQKRPLGSGDALNQTKEILKNFTGDIVVLCGDEPLIKTDTLRGLIKEHREKDNFCTLLSAHMSNPTGYGRVVRNDDGSIVKVVEEIEASVFEKAIEEINTGIYCFKSDNLFGFLGEIKNDNKKSEYFLTDIISLMRRKNLKIDSVTTDDSDEAMGINSRESLAAAERVLRQRISTRFMDGGVTIVDPDTTYIDEDVTIERDTTIYPHTIIERDVRIGRDCEIGPFARIRPGCELKDGVKIGNFVELVRTRIEEDTKVKHHAYLGDAAIGKNVNIGSGTITANYDGKGKYKTEIEDGAFIGSGTIFVAPVKVGRGATTGAGAVVTRNHDVPPKTVVVGIPAKPLVKKSAKRKIRRKR